MHSLDLRTLVFVANIILLVVTLSISLFTWGAHARERCLELWSLGFILKAFGFLGIFLRGAIPDFLSMPVANTLIVAGSALFFAGVSVFVGRGQRLRPALAATALAFVSFLYVTYFQPDYNYRVIVVSIFLAAFDLMTARECAMRAEPETRPARRLVTVFFLVDAVLFIVRCVIALVGPRVEGFFSFSLVSVLGVIEPLIMPVCLGAGFMAMVNQRTLAEKKKLIVELEQALANVKTLSGLLPICASCKKIRDDQGYWHQVESYLLSHSQASFTHGLCPDCVTQLYPEFRKHPKN